MKHLWGNLYIDRFLPALSSVNDMPHFTQRHEGRIRFITVEEGVFDEAEVGGIVTQLKTKVGIPYGEQQCYLNQLIESVLVLLPAIGSEVVIVLEEAVYHTLYSMYLVTLYPAITPHGFRRLLQCERLDALSTCRPCTDRSLNTITAQPTDYQSLTYLSSMVTDNGKALPLEHRLNSFLQGRWDSTLADEIKDGVINTIEMALGDIYASHALMYFTQRARTHFNLSLDDAIHLNKGLREPLKGRPLKQILNDTNAPTSVVDDIFHDLEFLAPLTLAVNFNRFEESRYLYRILKTTDDHEIITLFCQAITDGFSPLDYIDCEKIGIISVNVIAWIQTDEAAHCKLIPDW